MIILDIVDVGYNVVDIKIYHKPENNFYKLSMKIRNATKVVVGSSKKDAELRKAVMLLMCQSVEHGNNVDFL